MSKEELAWLLTTIFLISVSYLYGYYEGSMRTTKLYSDAIDRM